MAEQITDVDELRYQHHLTHRGSANHGIFWATWAIITIIALIRNVGRVSRWCIQRRYRRRRFLGTPPALNLGSLNRGASLIEALSFLPLPRFLRVLNPALTAGRLVLNISYIVLITCLVIAVDAPVLSEHFLDDVAFRAAWVTLTQISFVYFLSTKRGPLNILAGVSYERINCVHRWVGRVIFFTATTHMVIMKSSIPTQDIFQSHDKSMTVVLYGFGAFSVLVWIAVTSILPLRRWSYRAFYINHWVSTLAFLVLVFQHIPSYARSPVYLAASFVALDKSLVVIFFCRNNASVKTMRGRFTKFRRGPGRSMLVTGYLVEMTTPSASTLGLPTQTEDSTTIIRIRNIPFTWKPGQHIRLHIPALGALEMHPFTPANCSAMPPPPLPPRRGSGRRSSIAFPMPSTPAQTSEMLLIIRAHSGFTRRLAEYHKEWLTQPCPNASESPSSLTAYIDGPYGSAPAWEGYENLVLIATSSGVSFILAIMDHLEQLCFTGMGKLRTKSIRFVWIVRHVEPRLDEIVRNLLLRYGTVLRELDIKVEAEFYTTCSEADVGPEMVQYDPFLHLRQQRGKDLANRPALKIRHPDEIYDEWDREAAMDTSGLEEVDPFASDVYNSNRYSFESDEGSEMSTLVDGHSEDEPDEDPFSDSHATNEPDAAYRPLPPSSRSYRLERQGCQCAIIQHQRRKLNSIARNFDFIAHHFGTRPDILHILLDVVPRTSTERTMVAVCSNRSVVREARTTVAKMNIDVALKRRERRVELFVEGFG